MNRLKKLGLLATTGLVAFFGLYLLYNLLTDNFHTVIYHQLYRSAQPTAEELVQYIKIYHIKTIVNLRGKNDDKKWYQREIAICRRYHIMHYDISLSAHQLPTIEQLKQLVFIMQFSPKPILVHCLGGADRTGLASGIGVILSGDNSLDDLEDQISWQYNIFSPTTIGYQVMQNYLDWLAKHQLENNKQNFLLWLQQLNRLKKYTGNYFT